MIPGFWLTEGGQSATGSLLDYMIRNAVRSSEIQREADRQHLTTYEFLNGIVARIQESEKLGPEIAKEINILPYFLGNRSPNADPYARGIVSGVTLDESLETAARVYYATIQAIAYGTRHIIEEMNRKGYRIRRIHACGGGTKNPLWLQEHADVTGCEIVLPGEPEAVLLGTAMLAAVGAGVYASIPEASFKMGRVGQTIKPRKSFRRFHDAKYKVFRKMYADFRNYRNMLRRI
jgi:ribulose kinase